MPITTEGEQDPGQGHGQLELARHAVEAEVGDLDQQRTGRNPNDANPPHDDEHGAEQKAGEMPGGGLPFLFKGLGKGGGKGRRQGAFRKEVAKQVGNLEGGQERIVAFARPEHGGHDDFTHQPQDA
jgi:hypothetical protein